MKKQPRVFRDRKLDNRCEDMPLLILVELSYNTNDTKIKRTEEKFTKRTGWSLRNNNTKKLSTTIDDIGKICSFDSGWTIIDYLDNEEIALSKLLKEIDIYKKSLLVRINKLPSINTKFK
jgi:hypothetical protein